MSTARRWILAGVATAALVASSPARAVEWFGLSLSPLGLATLTLEGDDRLVVGNIGTSGVDGFRAQLRSERFQVEFEDGIEAASAPDGNRLVVRARDASLGLLGSVAAVDGGSHYDVFVDFTPLAPSGVTVLIFDGVTPVSGTINGDPDYDYPDDFAPQTIGVSILPNGSLCIMFMWDRLVRFGPPGAETVFGDRVMMISTNEVPLAPGTLAFVDVNASLLNERTLVPELGAALSGGAALAALSMLARRRVRAPSRGRHRQQRDPRRPVRARRKRVPFPRRAALRGARPG